MSELSREGCEASEKATPAALDRGQLSCWNHRQAEMTKQQGRQVVTLPSRHRRSALRRLFPLESIATVCCQLVKPRGVFMTIKIPCSCGTMLSADEKLAGKRVRCPRCKNEFK